MLKPNYRLPVQRGFRNIGPVDSDLGEDYRKVRSICEYLESSDDIIGLVHILEKLIDKPIHKRYALLKLMQHRSASAPLEDLLGWMSRLSKMDDLESSFRVLPVLRIT